MRLQALILVFAWATGVSGAVEASPDYPALFGRDWRAAEEYAAARRASWAEIWDGFGVDARVAEAVVFPEMVRYSALRDLAETAAVRALYQQRGSRGADFSIGRFQMKPSFAERVEREWMASEENTAWGFAFDTADNTDARRARIRRLDDITWQCTYLAMFLRLMWLSDERLAAASPEEQVSRCAAAYNGGGGRWFHTDFIAGPRTRYYSYAEVATYYYNNTLKTRIS